MKEKKLKGRWDDDIFHLVSGFADVTLFLLLYINAAINFKVRRIVETKAKNYYGGEILTP